MNLVRRVINRWNTIAADRCPRLCGNVQVIRVAAWNRSGGNEQLFDGLDLGAGSLVVDVGGYRGDWSAEIFARYAPTIHVLEPVPDFVRHLRRRFSRNPKIDIHPIALGAASHRTEIFVQADGSSVHRLAGEAISIDVVCASEFLRPLARSGIDLLKLNIEGAEFDVLTDLVDTGLIDRVRTLQVQFHDFVPDAARRMKDLHSRLSKTHRPRFAYEFVWETWERVAAAVPQLTAA
jgi:FkbM family methyltransferase